MSEKETRAGSRLAVIEFLAKQLGYSVKCLFSIQNYRVKATFYRVSLEAIIVAPV